MKTSFSKDVLTLDAPREADRIAAAIREQIGQQLKRKGAVVGLSGGIDSSVAAALCVRALGADRVLGLLMPEADSSPESLRLGRELAQSLGITAILEDVSPLLKAARCYQRRDVAIRSLIPGYTEDYKCKLVLPSITEESAYAVSSVVVQSPAGVQTKARVTAQAYREIIAAMNFKQRVRIMMEYHHADRLQYAVIGTPNRLEYDLGFFVKNGDGAADLKPIAHLYKTQVYQLAAYFNILQEIQSRPPTTDTYSLEQSQEEFYFSLPLAQMDLCLYGKDHHVPPAELAAALGLTEGQVTQVYQQIDSKRKVSGYLHAPPLLIQP
ncbi:MAG: NAD(+) synthase [Elusimicrobiota bacterium]|jgi:NAD+ synthase